MARSSFGKLTNFAKRGQALLLVLLPSIILIWGPDRSHRGFLYGDDFLLVNEIGLPRGQVSVSDGLWWTGLDKWRPIATGAHIFLVELFGFDYPSYTFVNSLVLLAVAFLAGLLGRELSSSMLVGIAVATFVTYSPNNWYFRYALHGLMEALALLFVLLFLLILVRAVRRPSDSGHSMALLALLAITSASLTHERYLFVLPAVWAVLVCSRSLPNPVRKTANLYLLVLFFSVSIRVFLLGVDPATGGGESSLRTGAGLWIGARLLDATGFVFGTHSPVGRYFSATTFGIFANNQSLGLTVLLPLGLGVVVAALHATRMNSPVKKGEIGSHQNFGLILLGITSLTCLVPAATVQERIESRWIFGSQVLVLIVLLTAATKIWRLSQTKITAGLIVASVVLTFTWPAVAYQDDVDFSLRFRDQVQTSLETLNSLFHREPWGVLISQTDQTFPLQWQYAYGAAFSQLKNRPQFVYFGSDFGACPRLRVKYRCVSVKHKGFETKPIITSWVLSPEPKN